MEANERRSRPINDKIRKGKTIPCMCCKKDFRSWDEKKNRLCFNCRKGDLTVFDMEHTVKPYG